MGRSKKPKLEHNDDCRLLEQSDVALIKAIANDDVEMLKGVLEQRADYFGRKFHVHHVTTIIPTAISNSGTLLEWAAFKGSIDIVKYLLSIENSIPLSFILHFAALGNRVEAMKVIFALKQQNVDIRDDKGRTPLHFAAFGGSVEAIKLLVELGADVNARDYKRCTPLHLASFKPMPFNDNFRSTSNISTLGKKYETIKKLVEIGADVNAQTNEEETALTLAFITHDTKVIGYLVTREPSIADENCLRLKSPPIGVSSRVIKYLIKTGVLDLETLKTLLRKYVMDETLIGYTNSFLDWGVDIKLAGDFKSPKNILKKFIHNLFLQKPKAITTLFTPEELESNKDIILSALKNQLVKGIDEKSMKYAISSIKTIAPKLICQLTFEANEGDIAAALNILKGNDLLNTITDYSFLDTFLEKFNELPEGYESLNKYFNHVKGLLSKAGAPDAPHQALSNKELELNSLKNLVLQKVLQGLVIDKGYVEKHFSEMTLVQAQVLRKALESFKGTVNETQSSMKKELIKELDHLGAGDSETLVAGDVIMDDITS